MHATLTLSVCPLEAVVIWGIMEKKMETIGIIGVILG